MAKQQNKGLGRGLDALLAGGLGSGREDELRELDVSLLRPGKYQPRTKMDEVSLEELAASIRVQGLMQPILVRQLNDGFEIIAGERRWRAAQMAGLDRVQVLVREVADNAALAMALIENIQREDLNPLEEALGIQRLVDEFQMTHQAAADAVGRSRSATSNLLRLLNLAIPVQELLMQGQIEMGHARALLSLDSAGQILLANKIAQEKLTVRDAERLSQQGVTPVRNKKTKDEVADRDIVRLQEALADSLGAKVTIKHASSGKGKVEIHYGSLDELDGLLAKLGKENQEK
jgi:ParB family chromosome partitioning protein